MKHRTVKENEEIKKKKINVNSLHNHPIGRDYIGKKGQIIHTEKPFENV